MMRVLLTCTFFILVSCGGGGGGGSSSYTESLPTHPAILQAHQTQAMQLLRR